MANEIEGNIFDIKRFALHDGPGIRTTLFMSGCPLKCLWCHNPESRISECVQGAKHRKVSGSDVSDELKKDLVFFEESGGGVTFSGGEPLLQSEFLVHLLGEMKDSMIHTAVDTTGYADRSAVMDILPLTDLFLFDLKVMDPVKHMEFTGVDNRVILQNLELIFRNNKEVRIRFPLIPGYNDDQENILQMISFIKKQTDAPVIDILPYHRMGISKYKKLKLDTSLVFISPPPDDKIEELKEMLKINGFEAGVGG